LGGTEGVREKGTAPILSLAVVGEECRGAQKVGGRRGTDLGKDLNKQARKKKRILGSKASENTMFIGKGQEMAEKGGGSMGEGPPPSC